MKPSRKQLVQAIRDLQVLVGSIGAAYGNDRDPHRADRIHVLVKQAEELAIRAIAHDPPGSPSPGLDTKGKW